LEAKDTELAKVRAELDAERGKRTDMDILREELRKAQADVKSVRRRNAVLRSDVDEARQNEKRKIDALTAEMVQSKAAWTRTQTHLVADVECTNEENNRLKMVMASLNAESGKLKQERDAAVRCHRQVLVELARTITDGAYSDGRGFAEDPVECEYAAAGN
jgi:chromosome segregation ATPase